MNTKRSFRILYLAILALVISLSACTAAAAQNQCPTPAAPTAEPATPTAIPPTPTPTPVPAGCSQPGEVKRYQIPSALLNLQMNVNMYLPPCYDADLAGGYPVAYLLHGQTFDDRMWTNLGAAELADALILSREAQPFIMIMPNEEFFYRPVRGNKFPDAIVSEVIPWAEATFNVCAARECRAIGGISRGAAWAMRIGLTNPQAFTAIGIHSLPSFLGGEGQVADWVKALPKDLLQRITMDSGRFDTEIKSAIPVEAVFNLQGLPHDWHLNEGRHDEDYWKAHIAEYISWYAQLWPPPD
ncbi:MAG: alpha/beta hydrolase-fold protein [Pelolinea sp.]|nr:alpha/beta hydrolase-fold protein [Pelolinea sp.]